MSPTPKINTALAELQADLPRIVKDRTAHVEKKAGGFYTYDFVELTDISDAILPRLSKLGLSFTARPTLEGSQFVLAYELRHSSGEELAGLYPLKAGTPQEMGGQITYARRYALCAVTGIAPAGDDDDAQTAQRSASRRSAREQAETRPARPNADEPKRISGAQMTKMRALLAERGYTGQEHRDAVLRYVSGVVNRQLASTTELTVREGSTVIERLVADKAAAAAAPPGEPEPTADAVATVAGWHGIDDGEELEDAPEGVGIPRDGTQ